MRLGGAQRTRRGVACRCTRRYVIAKRFEMLYRMYRVIPLPTAQSAVNSRALEEAAPGRFFYGSGRGQEHSSKAKLGVSEQTFYRYRKEYGVPIDQPNQSRRLKVAFVSPILW